ncbi:hypothetical protein L1987_45885 [Smallanthus sonchifolius]|uniref:Uncharacterized protein n=1 Tax=Smallanthus sonchifolius TaxID=185202 RepID=A0ACB9FY74_9ASTR|nr:hypothetical protein L1987_45885 [Smallanthus sonchifolius]
MDLTSNEYDRLVKIELEAAEALAGLAQFPATKDVSGGSESVAERVKDESNEGNSSFDDLPSNSYEICLVFLANKQVATNFMVKKPEKSGILTAKSAKDKPITELRLNPAYPTNCASSGRKSRQNLTEAEMEARKTRRVLANRESARQTIRRRQEKDTASKHYDSLKAKNECLKAQMKIMNNEAKETREESITTNEPAISASSTNSPFFNYVQPSFLPFVWPNSVQLQCGPPAGIVLPSHIPISPANANKPDSSSCEEGSSMTMNGPGTPLYLLPYPWLFTLPQSSSNENRPHSFNLNDKPKESCECQQFFPEKVKSETPPNNGFPPDGGGRPTTNAVSCEDLLIEHDDTNTVGDNKQVVGEIHQVPVVCSGKRLCDTAAAAEARKRRKQLTRLKNHVHCRQLRMH